MVAVGGLRVEEGGGGYLSEETTCPPHGEGEKWDVVACAADLDTFRKMPAALKIKCVTAACSVMAVTIGGGCGEKKPHPHRHCWLPPVVYPLFCFILLFFTDVSPGNSLS